VTAVETLIATKLGGGAPLLAAAVVSGLAGLVVTWLVAAVAGPEVYAEFAVFWALLFFMVSVLFGVQQEMARGTAAAEAAVTTASPWRRVAAVAGVVAVAVLATLAALAPTSLGPSWLTWSLPILAAVPCYVAVAAIQGAFAGSERWIALAILLTLDAVLRLGFTVLALLLEGGEPALAWATALPIPITAAVGLVVGGTRLRHARVDAATARAFHWNIARAVFAGLGAAFFVAGFPAALALFAGSAPAAQFATLVLVITLTRAPLLMPLSAIQTLLVVRFTRLDPRRLLRAEFAVLGAVAIVGAVGAVLGALIGPPLLEAVFGAAYEVSGETVALLVLGATAIAWLYVSGPATLARSLHGAYSLGWIAAVLVSVACLALPMPLEPRTILALVIGPVCGLLIHLAAQVVSLRRAPSPATVAVGDTQELP
jgi:O-antigen/teichoic acid export membrane protein